MKDKISIIMGTYNSEDTIDDAIHSILIQTYTNWEFIICDDASKDNTLNKLKTYQEKYPEKFTILHNTTNSKLAYSLNKCLKYSKGEYIARMDADDISAPNRFEKQVDFLKENRSVDLVGTAMQRFNGDEVSDVIIYAPKTPTKYTMRKDVPFNHATILTYSYVYDELEGYTVSDLTARSQDVELWFRFFYEGFKGENLMQALYYVREDANAIKRRTIKSRYNSFLINLDGFKSLNYPRQWYLELTIRTLLKMIVPYKIKSIYRKYLTKTI